MRCQNVNQLGWRCKMRALKGRVYCTSHGWRYRKLPRVEPKGRKW